MTKKIRVCFVGSLSYTFVKRDYETLKQYFTVNFIEPPKVKLGWLKYFLILVKEVRQCDLTFSWFAGWHSAFAVFFSKLFRKKSIVVVGGYDAAYVPDLNYGAFTNLKERIPVWYIYKKVDKALVVEPSLKDDIIRNAKIKGDNIDYLPLGYDPEYWKPSGKKEDIVLTVAGASTIQRVKLKGMDIFVKSSKYVKDVKFIVIGVKNEAKEDLKKISPKNVELIEFLPQNKLLQYYQKAKVYCQLSYREGLPSVLCEAMLCECIPVGSKANGVRTAIGDTGFYVDYGDEKATTEMIKKALASNGELGKKARERIKKLFFDKRRKEELEKLVLEMV